MLSFTVGPVQMYSSTKSVLLEKELMYFRTDEYSRFVNCNLSKLQQMLGLSAQNGIIYLASSGTGAMDATIDNCLKKSDKVLIINGGSFGRRFCELCENYQVPFDSIDLNWNESLSFEHLSKYAKKSYTHLLVNLDETSTGQLYNLDLLSEFCKENSMYLIVDIIGSFLADRIEMDKSGIDVAIFSSQKGLCLSPGVAFIAFSQRMKDRVILGEKPRSYYFNFKDYFLNISRGQTPFTPSVNIMYELDDMIKKIDDFGGIEPWIKRVESKAFYFRNKIQKLGVSIPSYQLSNMLTPVIFNDISAFDLFEFLKNRYQIYVNPCSGELSKKILRISHIGDTDMAEIDYLVDKIDEGIKYLKDCN